MTTQLAAVPSETATCANCSAPLVADQRYCLSCGQPASPVRLAFLDVLRADGQSQSGRPLAATPVAYAPLLEPSAGGAGWLRRYSPLFGVLTVLLLAVIAGLLVGHWVTQRNSTPVAATAQTIKIEGLGGLAASTSTAPTSTAPATTTPAKSGQTSAKEEAAETAKEEKAEKAQAKKAEKAPVLTEKSSAVKKLSTTTGKKHEEEINSLGAQPIETGSGK